MAFRCRQVFGSGHQYCGEGRYDAAGEESTVGNSLQEGEWGGGGGARLTSLSLY